MSFDPVHDSIMANKSAGRASPSDSESKSKSKSSSIQAQSPTVPLHSNPLKNILNPTDTPDPINDKSLTAKQKRSRETRKRKCMYKQNYSTDGSTPNVMSATQSKERERETKSYQTLLINSRTRHLKKNDGEPYWRNEIQFEFLLRLLFNRDRVFTNPYYESKQFSWPQYFKTYRDENGVLQPNDGEKLTFFELYLVTLLKSPKISKILNERLTCDIVYSLNFIIICLLVNIGRLNTTVNFDHEMKSQFRTYHSIPALQVGNHSDVIKQYYRQAIIPLHLKDDEFIIRGGEGYTMKSVKNLQDTPRIKSILKSINDLNSEIPKNFKEFITGSSADSTKRYDLNVISLIFMLCVHEHELYNIFFLDENGSSLSSNKGGSNSSNNKSSSLPPLANMGTSLISKYDPPKNDDDDQMGSLFNEIWLNTTMKPKDKVRRFLWLIYLFKETDFKLNHILTNPFNDTQMLHSINDLNPSANIAEEITAGNKFLISKLRMIVPTLRPLDTDHGASNTMNDIDTDDEVIFAGNMKDLRAKFLEQDGATTAAVATVPANNNAATAIETSNKPITEAQTGSTMPAGNHQSHETKLEAMRNLEVIRNYTDETKARKKRKMQQQVDLPVKINSSEFEGLFNTNEIKSSSSNSRQSINKRYKNKLVAEFLKEIVDFKVKKYRENLSKHSSLLHNYKKLDPNLLLVQNFESDDKEGSVMNSFGSMISKADFEDTTGGDENASDSGIGTPFSNGNTTANSANTNTTTTTTTNAINTTNIKLEANSTSTITPTPTSAGSSSITTPIVTDFKKATLDDFKKISSFKVSYYKSLTKVNLLANQDGLRFDADDNTSFLDGIFNKMKKK